MEKSLIDVSFNLNEKNIEPNEELRISMLRHAEQEELLKENRQTEKLLDEKVLEANHSRFNTLI